MGIITVYEIEFVDEIQVFFLILFKLIFFIANFYKIIIFNLIFLRECVHFE